MNLREILVRQFRITGALAFLAVAAVTLQAQERSLPDSQTPREVTMSGEARMQVRDILAEKAQFTPAQKKMSSRLVFAAKAARFELARTSFAGAVSPVATDERGHVVVEIAVKGAVPESLVRQIEHLGGQVLFQSDRWGQVRASLPLKAVEEVAAADAVASIKLPSRARTNIGAVTSQGVVSHGANTAKASGYDGTGVKVGVLSDSASAARVAVLIASGDLPPDVVVLPGQDGAPGTDEGAAMMEIVHDLAPGAKLYFATAYNGVASFANNILALQAAGCNVIVDDVTYFDEGVFQDGPIAQAVNEVTGLGVTYFSSAANSGNLTDGTSGTWEGDFLNGGVVTGPIGVGGETGFFHNFGTTASPQNYDSLTVATSFISLKWSDRLGGSSNDYDLFILNSTGTTVKGFSAGAQTGAQDPFEFVEQGTNCGTVAASGYCPAAGDRIVVVLFNGESRALHIDTERGQLSVQTAGATFGHNAGLNTVSTAATYWNSAKTGTKLFTGFANRTETFSSDGPRKIFYDPDGSAITPGNFLFGTNGGTTLQKPDITAADGVSTHTPGFSPFFGTSAAAPHAAALAALVLQARPDYTPAKVKAALIGSALDNMAVGADRDGGFGIPIALPSINFAISH